jgi:hypothetical protein
MIAGVEILALVAATGLLVIAALLVVLGATLSVLR